MLSKNLAVVVLAIAALGCSTSAPRFEVEPPDGGQLDELYDAVADQRSSLQAIAALEAYLADHPSDRLQAVRLAKLRTLHGAAYTDGRRAKARVYDQALAEAEAALRANPGIAAALDAGEPLWAAVEGRLETSDLDAAVVWATVIFYEFEETRGALRRALGSRWITRARKVIAAASAVDRQWQGGVLPFSDGIVHTALPTFAGGDRERARAELAEAIQLGPERLLGRWGRARYFRVVMGERQGFIDDLEWVLAQDPETAPGDLAWNRYFHRDARRLLDQVDEIF